MSDDGFGPHSLNGFSIYGNTLPSKKFYCDKNRAAPELRPDPSDPAVRIRELECKQQELHDSHKRGEIDSAQYQKKWNELEEDIKILRQNPDDEGEDE